MANARKWVNRPTDSRSTLRVIIGAIATTAFVVVAMAVAVSLSPSDEGWSNYFLIPLAILSFALYLFTLKYAPLFVFRFSPRHVPLGHAGLIKFGDHYTGEIAESGPIMLPLGYDFEPVDCRQFILESGLSEVRSRDGFVVKANLTTWLKVSNPLRYRSEGFSNDEMNKVLRSALFSAASRNNALDIVGNRDQICQEALNEVSELASHYGVEAAKVAVDVQSIPDDLTNLVQMLSKLEKHYPQASPADLIDIIMLNSGKITKNRTETTNINRLEVPGLDLVMAAAAKRFG